MSKWSSSNPQTPIEKKYGLRSADSDREDGKILADGCKHKRALIDDEEYQETESEPGSLFDRRR